MQVWLIRCSTLSWGARSWQDCALASWALGSLKTAVPLEKSLEGDVCAWAEARGFFVRKMSFPSQRGATDRLLLSPNGDILFVEFKRKGTGVLSPAQKDFRHQLQIRGLIHYVFDEYETSIQTLQKFL